MMFRRLQKQLQDTDLGTGTGTTVTRTCMYVQVQWGYTSPTATATAIVGRPGHQLDFTRIGGCSTFHLVKVMKTVTGCQVFCKENLVCVNFFTRVCQFFCSCVSIFLLTPTSRPQGDLFNSRPYILYSI
jgi:hypothetical protein